MYDNKTLLKEIQALEFAMLETNLYLDGTDDPEAIAYYEKKRRELEAKKKEYCRPLLAADGVVDGRWVWTEGPWPWECEAN